MSTGRITHGVGMRQMYMDGVLVVDDGHVIAAFVMNYACPMHGVRAVERYDRGRSMANGLAVQVLECSCGRQLAGSNVLDFG